MPKFAIIAEGPTDQTVIENIILGFFQGQEEPYIHYIQPPRPLDETPAGWGHVFKSLERKEYVGALQFNDYLVIHIDTDVQEESGFNVPRQKDGKVFSLAERVEHVIVRLKQDIDTEFLQVNANRILFAIAVDSIESWLLPLLYPHAPKMAAKTTDCLESANNALRKANRKGLSAGENKFIRAYEDASSEYRKLKILNKYRTKNPSLELFIKQLDNL